MLNIQSLILKYIFPTAGSAAVIGTAIYKGNFFQDVDTFSPNNQEEEKFYYPPPTSNELEDKFLSALNLEKNSVVDVYENKPIYLLENPKSYEVEKISIVDQLVSSPFSVTKVDSNLTKENADIYRVLTSFSLDQHTFLKEKNKKYLDPLLLLDFQISIDENNQEQKSNAEKNNLTKSFFLTHYISYKELISLDQKTINVAKISQPNSKTTHNIFLNINKSKNQQIVINLLLQKDKTNNETEFKLLEETINFNFLYKNSEITYEILDTEEKVTGPKITLKDPIKLSEVIEKTKKSISNNKKNWLTPWIFSGYEPTNNSNISEQKFYLEKGNLEQHGQLLKTPTNISSISKNKKQSPFKLLESNNPKKIGGYLKDVDPINFTECKNDKTKCKEDVSDNKKLSAEKKIKPEVFIDYDFEEVKKTFPFPHGGLGDDVYYVRRLCRWNPNKKQPQACHIQPYNYPWQTSGISPHIAKNLHTYQTGKNTETIPWFEYYKDKYKLPELAPQFLQSVYEQKDKTQVRDGAKLQAVATANNSNEENLFDPNNDFFLNYEVPFRTMGGNHVVQKWEGWREYSSDKPYDEEVEKNLRTKHGMTYKILKKDWNEKLINSDVWGKEGTPQNIDKKTKLGMVFNLPIKLKIQDVVDNFFWEGDYEINNEINLSSFSYSNKFLINEYTVSLNKLFPSGIGVSNFIRQDDKRITKLHGNIKLFVYASLDENGLKIEVQTQTEGVVNDRVSVFNLRDLDVSLSPRMVDKKPAIMIAPHHIKMPTLIGVEFSSKVDLIPFWWTSSADDEFTISKLHTSKLNERTLVYKKELVGDERQLQYTMALSSRIVNTPEEMAKKSKNLKEKNVQYSGWTSTTNYLNVFGINDSNSVAEEKTTTVKVPIPKQSISNYKLKLKLEGLDSESATLLFNPTYKHATQQTIFTNGGTGFSEANHAYLSTNSSIFKEEPIKDDNSTHHKYEKKEENKSFFDLKKYDLPTDLLIDISSISTDANKPSLIPFRLTVNHDKTYEKKNWNDLKDAVKKVAASLLKNDKTKLGKSTNNNASSAIIDVSKLSELTSIKSSFAAVFWDVLAWKTETDNELTINLQLKIWGWGYSYYLPSNTSNTSSIAAQGAAGFQLSEISFIHNNNKNAKHYQMID